MRRYEVVCVLAPKLTEEEVKQSVETFSAAAQEKGATVLEVDEIGKRRLAYPVANFNDGIYVILHLEEEAGTAVAELERRFLVTDSVIRFLTIRVDEHHKRADKLRQRREARKKRRAAARKAKPVEQEATAATEE